MCVPVSIGFGKTALVLARIEYSIWQLGVRSRKHATTTCGISTFGTWLPGEESAIDAGPWMNHATRDCLLNPTEPERMLCPVRQLELYIQSAYVHTLSLELQLQRYHEEPRKPMDRGDCQGSLHSSWSLVRPCDNAWGPSAFSFMGVQLSGGSTWHPVSGVLEVFRGVPEFVSARHGSCCWGHVNTGSSGGCTTRSGSRTSSPSSIAYTICMARNPPTCPAEKRSLGENLVSDWTMWYSAQVRLRMDRGGDSISLCEISPGIGRRADYMQPLLLRSVHADTS